MYLVIGSLTSFLLYKIVLYFIAYYLLRNSLFRLYSRERRDFWLASNSYFNSDEVIRDYFKELHSFKCRFRIFLLSEAYIAGMNESFGWPLLEKYLLPINITEDFNSGEKKQSLGISCPD